MHLVQSGEIFHTIANLVAEPVTAIAEIGGGGNSRVFRVETASRVLAAKAYFQRTADGRDRLSAEFEGLRFLWNQGVRCVPQPILADGQAQLALYEFIPGRVLLREEISTDHIDQLVQLLVGLKQLTGRPGADELPAAAEASFSVAGVVQNIRHRLGLLDQVEGGTEILEALRDFLNHRFRVSLDRWEAEAQARLGNDYHDQLPDSSRTLSPSDFGFHNALLQDDGTVKFVDFEYFGWDDPVKMISDFLWHPRSTMPESLKARFASKTLASFLDIEGRLQPVFPLFGLKWCLILLNEFRPENLQRRRFAKGNQEDTDVILKTQFDKARTTLERVDLGPPRFVTNNNHD